ncbi:hypothetical protein DFR70_10253 [Nocardia tenerifensis]|uniref:Uncharacterized protein n=1 Tax=Nocardia tenerifensis TaxID=228006 RepID=A0A318K660_9NOCA|nr:hypothetical protein [Nocardia tenerifensis]PXX68373.1 hypothetical protein DFR70_10253 [Nocardia tenerifensis]
MRLATLAVLILALSACSHSTSGRPQPTVGEPPTRSTTTATTATPQSPESQLKDRIGWVKEGNSVDASRYHSASLGTGPATDLKSDIAFVSPTGKISCITGTEYQIDGFHCVVKLKNPVPKPGEGFGNWDGGYVNYSGQQLSVGQFRGDPGLFIHGEGQTLPYDSKLTFGNYLCRIATSGLTCVNPATRSGVQMSDEGVVPFGCLREVSAAEREASVGRTYSC